MTWIAVVSIVVISLIKIVLTCLPTGAVEWILRKFETHSKLSDASAAVSLGGKRLEGKDKRRVIDDFNEAVFIERHYIYQGMKSVIFIRKTEPIRLSLRREKEKRCDGVCIQLRRSCRCRQTAEKESRRLFSSFRQPAKALYNRRRELNIKSQIIDMIWLLLFF